MAFPEPRSVLCPYPLWWTLFQQLKRRGGGARESGAFLLGVKRFEAATVKVIVYYDDIDPDALSSGIVRLSGHAMHAVWQTCANKGLEVVADIHTHPGRAGQSRSDQDHPMVAIRGHLAVIAPRFARNAFDLAGIGVYRYRGSKLWDNLPPPRLGWLGVRIRGA